MTAPIRAQLARGGLPLVLFLLLSAFADSAPTARVLLGDIDRIEHQNSDIVRRAAANLELQRKLEQELARWGPLLDELAAERAELAAFCNGFFDIPEYEIRRIRCEVELPILNRKIETLKQTVGEIRQREEDRVKEALGLRQALVVLAEERTKAGEAATRLPYITGLPCARGASWAQCMRASVCGAVERRTGVTRATLERNRVDLAASSRELEFWTRMNGEAQKGALAAGLRFVVGEYAASSAKTAAQLDGLAREAHRLATKAVRSPRAAERARYVRLMENHLKLMRAPSRDLLAKLAAGAALSVDEQWSAAQTVLQAEFAMARKRDMEIVTLIQSSQFREAFESDGIDTSQSDLLATLAEEAGKGMGEHLLGTEHFAASVAPAVRAFTFFRDSTYNALLSALSTQRVVQQSDLAGDLAVASRVLQERYEDDVLDQAACRSSTGRLSRS